jgi:hypothetical protein
VPSGVALAAMVNADVMMVLASETYTAVQEGGATAHGQCVGRGLR